MTRALTSSLLALALLAPLGAQRTWFVDAAGGPTADFTEISHAVAAAAAGDRIVVRPGLYLPFKVDGKALAVLGDSGARVQGGFHVRNLPAGRAAAVRGITVEFAHPSLQIGVELVANQAPVHLDQVLASSFLEHSTLITDCVLVTANSCILGGETVGVHVLRSAVAMDDTTVRGGNPPALTPNLNGVALLCEASTVHVGGGRILGADELLFADPTGGIELRSGRLVLGAPLTVRAGATPLPLHAIRTSGGHLTIDPNVVLQSSGGASPISGPATVVQRPVAVVETSSAAPGGLLGGAAYARPGDTVVTFLGLPAPPQPTPVGDLWAAVPVLVADTGTVGSSGRHVFALPIPASIAPASAFAFQAIAVGSARLDLSTPSVAVVGY